MYVGGTSMQKFEPLAQKPNPQPLLKANGQFINRNCYFFDGADIHLLLHIPMAPKDSLL
jgi:hypothetical protein